MLIRPLLIFGLIRSKSCFQITETRNFVTKIVTKFENKKNQFQYLSDVHVDTRINCLKHLDVIPKCGTLLIAGDIGSPFHENFDIFIGRMSRRFNKVIFVAGNHEYESGCLFDQNNYIIGLAQIKKICKSFPNVFFLDNDVHIHDSNTIIAGTTLWTNPNIPFNMRCNIKINKCHSNTNKIEAVDAYDTHVKKHNECLDFINNACKKFYDKNVIVLSHYVPTFKLIEKKFLSQQGLGNGWFATNLDHLMKKPIRAWICGHSHSDIETNINDVFCGINAYGYKNDNSKMITTKTFSL